MPLLYTFVGPGRFTKSSPSDTDLLVGPEDQVRRSRFGGGAPAEWA